MKLVVAAVIYTLLLNGLGRGGCVDGGQNTPLDASVAADAGASDAAVETNTFYWGMAPSGAR